MSQQITDALLKLDRKNDSLWTNTGMPKINALGIENITRSDIVGVAPHFTRDNPVVGLPEKIESVVNASIQDGLPDLSGVAPKVKVAAQTEIDTNELLKDKKVAVEELAAAQKVLVDAQKLVDVALAKHDDVVSRLEDSQKGRTTQHDVMDYIESQNKIREQKAARHAKVINSGIDLSALMPSPIDAAIARKNTRGVKSSQKGMVSGS